MTDSISPLPPPVQVPAAPAVPPEVLPPGVIEVLPPGIPEVEAKSATPLVALDAARKDQKTLHHLLEEAAMLDKQLQDMRKELAAREAAEDERAMEDANWFERELAQEKLERARNKIPDESRGEPT